MAVLSFLLLGLVILYCTNRHHQRNTPSKATTTSSPIGSESPKSSPPQLTGTNKRTGILGLQRQQQHTRYPSLEHGSGPTLVTTPPPNTPAVDTIRAVITTPATSSACIRMQPPATGASNNRSSLHQAMLDVGAEDSQKNCNDSVEEDGEDIKTKNLKNSPASKAYTGAWPLRDISSAYDDR